MFARNQIEAAVEKLGVPFNHMELEAMRKLILCLVSGHIVSTPKAPRSNRRPVEKIEDVITSDEVPSVLIERHGYSIATIRAIKAGYGPYAPFGGCRDFWRDYRRQYRHEIKSLVRKRR